MQEKQRNSEPIKTFRITITDEFHNNFSMDTNDREEVLDRVAIWLANMDSSPLYDIHIEINQ